MFSQEKTGKFIAEQRKEAGLTQRQLAEKLNISDKTISKWETGNGMPDTSIMEELCTALDINVNELLSGERLPDGSYNGKAEKNMMELMKEKEEQKRGARIAAIVGTIAGVALAAIFLLSCVGLTNGIFFIDMPSLICILGFDLLGLGLSGQLGGFLSAFPLCFGKRGAMPEEITAKKERVLYALRFTERLSVLSGALGSVFGFVMSLTHISTPELIGPNLAVAVLTLFYGFLFAIVFLIIEGRVKRL